MTAIELVWDSRCPDVEETRGNLRAALEILGRAPRWQEWDRSDPRAPARIRDAAAPAVLVGGHDVRRVKPLARTTSWLDNDLPSRPAPPVPLIVAALGSIDRAEPREGF